MQEKLRQGYWVNLPPKGYINTNKNTTADKHHLEINAEGRLIKRAFEMRANGHSYGQIVEKLQPLGLTTKEKHLGALLGNPFYAGFITHNLIPGEIVKGKHTPLVTEALFLKVNTVEEGKTQQRVTTTNNNLPLKTFMKEEESGSPFTGYIAKKGDIAYYKTRFKETAVNLNADLMNETVKRMLTDFAIDPALKSVLKQKMLASVQNKMADQLALEITLKKEKKAAENQLEKLHEKFVKDEITAETYRKFKTKLEAEISEKERQLNKAPIKSSNLEKAVENGIKICSNPATVWASSSYTAKRALQTMLFPEGILVSKEKRTVRTPRVNTIIFEIARQQGTLAHKKTGINDFEIVYPRWVGPPGLEPGTT